MNGFLIAVRRRLRVAWAVATATWVGPAVAALVVVVVGLGRVRPWAWPEPAAIAVAAAALAGIAGVALLRPIPLRLAARAADRGLATGDAFVTALELGTGVLAGGPFAERVERRALVLATGQRAGDAVAVPWAPRRLALVTVLALAALGLGLLPNPQDEVRQQRADERAAARREAAEVREAAKALANENPQAAAAAKQLEELAQQLERAADLAAAQRAVERTAAALAGALSPEFLAQKAAVRGLDRTLANQPLAGAAAPSAAGQLAAAAQSLAGMTPEEQAALAQRLRALAAAQTAGNPETAAGLDRAAAALEAGDVAGAAAALGEAGAAQSAAAGSVGAQEAAASALATTAAAQAGLSQSQGQGQGQGKGQGQGQGQGQGGGGGGGSGAVGGATGAGGQGGRGGQGTANGSGNNPSVGLETATVYNPVGHTEGEQLQAGGSRGEGPAETVGRQDGPTGQGSTRVPVREVLPRYRSQATTALDRLDIPPSVRSLVRAYFDSLATEG